jgi:hypothetical protein
MNLFRLNPEYLTQYINFNYKNPDWQFDVKEDSSMEKIQAEGSAKIWNLLLEHKIALLADEVGMGKTIQALAVICTLWRQKPDAKVLIYAPNETVALKWKKEYLNFIRFHYRFSDNLIKSDLTNEPLSDGFVCENHFSLLDHANKKWPSLFICKISSLSNLHSKFLSTENLRKIQIKISRPEDLENASDDIKEQWIKDIAWESNQAFYQYFNSTDAPFDLLIIDEAQYLRRTENEISGTNRSISSNYFFKGLNPSLPSEKHPLASMVLLMTATPNHSSQKDIQNIVKLFDESLGRLSSAKILDILCVRRFGRLCSKTKHNYRNEKIEGSQLITTREILFFGAYQKTLITNSKNKKESTNTNAYRVMLGYLEGFEFFSNNETKKYSLNKKEDLTTQTSVDFSEQIEDHSLIKSLSEDYKRIYHRYPDHPKYDHLIRALSNKKNNSSLYEEKTLVFVRRIPSVFEISRRVIENYDSCFLELLKECKPEWRNLKFGSNLRRVFYNEIKKSGDTIEEESSDQIVVEEDRNIPISMVLDLFTVKKADRFKTTDCTNFKNRFTRNTHFFSIFFQPGSNYMGQPYKLSKLSISTKSNKKLTDILQSAINERLEVSKANDSIERIKLKYNPDHAQKTEIRKWSNEFPTLMTIWWNSKVMEINITEKYRKAKEEYVDWTLMEREGFCQYLEKGILLGSPFIIHFYAIFKKNQQKSNKVQSARLYQEFCKRLSTTFDTIGLLDQISDAILTFRFFYKKEMGIEAEKLMDQKFNIFNNTNPIYPYYGGSKRPAIINAFNTPFFPFVIVATSVLQEGVDLHLHCKRVIHYGIAWTYGDNEQRVGRVDRMFGKLDRELKENAFADLPITYPYLEDTIDENQLICFAKRKSEAEELIDQLKDVKFNKTLSHVEQSETENWKLLFNEPDNKRVSKDPFGVKMDDFQKINLEYFKINFKKNQIIQHFISELTANFNDVVNLYDENDFTNGNQIAAIKYIFDNNRHQPVVIELHYFEEGHWILNRPVYVLVARTPLGKREDLFLNFTANRKLKEAYFDSPNIKICFDTTVRKRDVRNNLFRIYSRIDLPVIIDESSGTINISKEELIYNLQSLMKFSDDLEKEITGKDIQNEEIINKESKDGGFGGIGLPGNRTNDCKWEGWNSNSSGTIVYREATKFNAGNNQSFELNHQFFLRRHLTIKKETFVQYPVYKKDALDIEKKLLEGLFAMDEQ